MTLKDLNQEYFDLYDDLFHSRNVLTDKQFDVMAQTLLKQYVEELDICLTERLLEVGQRNFELKFRSQVYVPRHRLFGYNRIGKLLLKKYKAEFLTELKRLELDISAEKDTCKKVSDEIKTTSGSPSTLPVPRQSEVGEVADNTGNAPSQLP